MTLDLSSPRVARAIGRLHGGLLRLLERAGARALRLHSERVTLEHLVGASVEDEESAAYQVVEHAFADPDTLSQELLALSPGVMVVGTASTLPFSPAAVRALSAARDAAAGGEVGPGLLLAAAAAELPADVRADLASAGLVAAAPPRDPQAPRAPSPETGGESLFRRFSQPAKRAASQASREASAARETSIGPARLVLACLRVEPELEGTCGLSGARARAALAGRSADPEAPAARPLDLDPALVDFLEALPAGADSLDLLVACHRAAGPELGELLARHKVTEALLERSRGAFADPPGSGPAGAG